MAKAASSKAATSKAATSKAAPTLAQGLTALPTAAPINKALPTTGFAYGYATAAVWLVAHGLAQQGTTPTTANVYGAMGGQQGLPHTAYPVVALKAGYTGTVHCNWHTVNTQVGHYNNWANGVATSKVPRAARQALGL